MTLPLTYDPPSYLWPSHLLMTLPLTYDPPT